MHDTPPPTGYFHISGRLMTPETQLRRTVHYRVLLRELGTLTRRHNVRLLSFCLLPHAWDLVVATPGTKVPGSLIEGVRTTRRTTQVAPEKNPMPVAITRLLTGADLIGCCVMVERRPVARGLVRLTQDWPWSSAAERFRLRARVPLMSPRILLSPAWFDHLNAPRPGDASRGAGLDDLAQPPRLFASRSQVGQQGVDIRRPAHEDHADTHVEGTEHLRVGHRPASLKPREKRRHGPTPMVE